MNQQRISNGGLMQLMSLEGCKLQSYRDSANILTIGYGHTSSSGQPQVVDEMRINQEQAQQILRRDVRKYEDLVNRLVQVPLNISQFAAMVIFSYNVGAQNFEKSSLLQKLNQGQYDLVPIELMKWVHVRGAICPGLVHRRSKEAALWHKSSYTSRKYSNMVTVDGSDFAHKSWVGARALVPLTGIVAAVANMVASSPVLQFVLGGFILLSAGSGLYYYHKYYQKCAL